MQTHPVRPARPLLLERHLSPARRRLCDLVRGLYFGEVRGLRVRDGEPVLVPPPALVREYKFGADNGPHPHRDAPDSPVKEQFADLFRYLDEAGDATIAVLEVRHGLPFRMILGPSPA
jgi:hypothetical protein